MAGEKIYTIVLNQSRIEVSKEVYYAYHQEREAERYQLQLIHQKEMSLERFQEEGVNVEYHLSKNQDGLLDGYIRAEVQKHLYHALEQLSEQDRILIQELFFYGTTEALLAGRLGITQQAVSKRKQKLLRQIRNLLE